MLKSFAAGTSHDCCMRRGHIIISSLVYKTSGIFTVFWIMIENKYSEGRIISTNATRDDV